MEDEKENSLIEVAEKLNDDEINATKQIIEANSLDDIKDLTPLFNLSQIKKNTLRLTKLNDLYDQVTDRMLARIKAHPGEFSNSDLISYMNVVQAAIEKTNKSIDGGIENTTTVQINQQNNTLNVNMDDPQLDRQSRERVLNAVNALLEQFKGNGGNIDEQ